jgi:hypothetical protein
VQYVLVDVGAVLSRGRLHPSTQVIDSPHLMKASLWSAYSYVHPYYAARADLSEAGR